MTRHTFAPARFIATLPRFLEVQPKQGILSLPQRQQQPTRSHLLDLTVAPQSPVQYGDPWTNLILQVMNRNARRPRRANRGKRPVSRVAKREKKRRFGNHRR